MSQLFVLPFNRALNISAEYLGAAVLNFYYASTSVEAVVYADADLTISLGSTVTADAYGKFVNIYMSDAIEYRVALLDKDGVVIGDVDNYTSTDITSYKDIAEEAADRAQGYATALTLYSGGYFYPDLPSGGADTPSGEAFIVVTDDGHVQLALSDGTTGTVKAEFLTLSTFNTPGYVLVNPNISNGVFTGTPVAPTAAAGTNTTQLATTAFVTTAVANGLATLSSLPQSTVVSTTGSADANTIGFRGLPNRTVSAADTFILADQGGVVISTGGGMTIPADTVTNFPVGAVICFYNNSTSAQNVAVNTQILRLTGTSTTGTRSVLAYGFASFIKIDSSTWLATGDVT